MGTSELGPLVIYALGLGPAWLAGAAITRGEDADQRGMVCVAVMFMWPLVLALCVVFGVLGGILWAAGRLAEEVLP